MKALSVRGGWLRSCCRALWSVLLLSLALPPLAAQTLQLADGQVLLAQVEDSPNTDGLRVRRLDNGGLLELRWDQLSDACALRIKQAYALAGEEQGELTVTASEVRYMLNGSQQTIIGKVLEGGAADVLQVQQKGVVYPVPRAEITQVRQIEVPVAQVFTLDEFYSQRLLEIAPGDQADKHALLADDLLRIRDYPRALEHLQKAKELGNSRAPEEIDHRLERAKLYIAAKKERDLLDAIQVARARGTAKDFENGGKLIAQFEKDYPQSKLKGDFDSERKRFDAARTRFYVQQVAEQWRRQIQIVADKKVQEPGVTLAGVREYAESKMSDDIAAAVAQRLKLDLEETKKLWSERASSSVGKRSEHFSYGIGTWVLSDEAIVKGTKQGQTTEKQPANASDQAELDKIVRAIKKAMEQRNAAAQGKGGAAHEQTDEEWWTETDRPDRGSWLRAYYAEFGGQLVVVSAFTQPCFNCASLGTTSEIGEGGKVIKVPCYLCHGKKYVRTFKAY